MPPATPATTASPPSTPTAAAPPPTSTAPPPAPPCPAPPAASRQQPGSTQINLSWTAPASTGGSAITGYKIDNGTSGWTDQVANTSSTTTTYAHTGLGAGDTRHYRVSAINANGSGAASNVDSATTGTTVPGAPSGLTTTASGSTQINLSWTVPASTGGSAITGYKIEVSPNGTSGWTDQVANTGSTATTYAHTGLAAGDTRHYRVSAINANGSGTASNVDSATTGTTVPGAPTGLSATASGTTQINLSWTAPAITGGSAIIGYKIEVSSNGGTSWTTLVADTGNANTTYQHTGLTASSTRHYRVSAINANGAGTASNVDSATTGTTVPGAPSGLSATASGSTQIDLSWTVPASDGGSAITGYKIEVSPNGTSGWTDQVANTSSTATTYAHTGLASGDTRHYRVSAINTNGSGTASNVDSATTGTTVPGAPTGLTATASGATQINLSWSAPASDGGSAITGYKIEVSSNGGTSWTTLVADTGNATTTYQHTGLTASSTRHYRVSAINANGSGTASNVDSATTGTTVPGAPSGLTATASGTTQINLSWTAPAITGGSAITGYKIEVSPNGTSGWTDQVANTGSTTTTYAHTGLASGDTRHYRVSAINTNGSGTASNVDSATTGTTVPGAPSGLSATASGSTQINLSWTAPASDGGSAITGYKIEVSPNGTSGWTDQVANTGSTTTTYAHTGLAPGSTRHYRVSAINTNGSGTASNVDSATTGQTTVTFATLSALTVSPKDIIGFVADRTSYEVGVASTVTQATITATKSHSAATVAYSTTDADTSAGHQVNLSDGRNEVTITVTAEDTTTTGTYTVSINRGVTDAFGWKASDDFDGLITAENNRPRGMWSDGTTMWVTDWIDIKIYAYDMTTKAHDASKDFDTLDAAGNDNPRGIWSDGTTVWVSDYSDEKLYAYDMTTKARDASKDFDTANLLPTGIWSDGTTMWVAAQVRAKIYAYDMSTKARDADKDFDTLEAAGNNYPGGIWSNNITMWVAEEDDDKLYAYNMASKARDADKDFNTLNAAGNGETGGIWANTNTMWASDTIDYKIYSYNMPLIAPNIPAAGTPAVTAPNVFRVPAVLSADLTGITDTDGVTGIATNATYKWQRFAANGTTLDTDSVGTGSTYTLTDADAGKTLKVVVSFTDNGGNSEGPLTSAATSAITAAAICAAPSLTGGATFLGPARKIEVGRISFIGSLMYGYSKASGKGSLDNAMFTTAASNNYEIVVITNSSSILVEFDTALTADDRSTLVVHICDQAYAFSSSDSFIQHEFTTPLQNWAPHAERTIYLSQDTAAPTFASATVNGTSLVITLSEPLSAAASLANSAFTVKKGPSGSQTTLTLSGTAPVISGSTVTLTLASTSSVTATDTNVLVTYTKPGTGTANKLVDAFGNETGTFADQVVTNLLSTTVPGAPSGLTATASGTTQIDLSWSAPASTGGSAITGYKIESSSDGGSSWTDLVANTSNATTTYAHTGLTAGTTRHYRVSAINANGSGAASNVDSATTGTTVPGAPSGLSATASGTTQINLSWTAPAITGGSAITGYKIEVSSNGGSSWTDQVANTSSTTTTYAHTGLGAGDTRHYRVSAINANGSGAASNVDSATTGTTVPGAPTGLTATASGTTAINLSWSAPASTGGSAITGYKIESSSDGGSSWSDLVANTSNTATTYAHTGLAAGTTRHYRVSAINANGAGTASNVDSATTGTTVPGAPTGLTATASGTTAINLSWSAPASTGGSAITGYKIEVSPNGTSGWTDQVANTSSTTTTYAHTGLTASSTRHYRVSAINANGSGTASNVDSATTGTTGTTVPGAPTGLTATASGTTAINLSWSAPSSNGGSAITGYRIEVSPNGASNWTVLVANTNTTATTYAHTGLAAATTRHYRVSAINANGAGPTSNTDSATTAGAGAPGAPTGLTATASGSTQINLSWSAPGSTGGAPITGYRIEVSSNGGSSWTNLVANTNSTTTTYAHSGLAAGTTRHYRVSAINSNGAGTASNVDSATTAAAGAPGAPTRLSATASGPDPDQPLLERPLQRRRRPHHRLQDRGLPQRRLQLDRPRRQHQQHRHDLRPQRAWLPAPRATTASPPSTPTGAGDRLQHRLRHHRRRRRDDGDVHGLLVHGLGGPRREGDYGGAERGAIGAGEDPAGGDAPGRRHGGGLLGRAVELDVRGRADSVHVRGGGHRRLARGRRRERADRVRDAAGRVRAGRAPDGDRDAGGQRQCGPSAELRHGAPHHRQGARERHRVASVHAVPEHEVVEAAGRQSAAAGDDPAGGDAPGRGDTGGLRGEGAADADERDVRGGRERDVLLYARDPGRQERDRRGPAAGLRPTAGGGEQGHLGAVRNDRVRGPGPAQGDGVVRGRILHGHGGRRPRAGVDPSERAGGNRAARCAAGGDARGRDGGGLHGHPEERDVRGGRADADDHGDGNRRYGRRRRRERDAVVRQ